MERITVRLAGEDHPVVVPRSGAVCKELILAVTLNPRTVGRVAAAMVGICVPSFDLGPRPPSYERCGYDVLRYGGEVWDALSRLDVADHEMLDAYNAIGPLLQARAFPPDEGVGAEVGFSSPPAEVKT